MIKLLRRLLGKTDRKEATQTGTTESSNLVYHGVSSYTTDESQEQQAVVVAYDPESNPSEYNPPVSQQTFGDGAEGNGEITSVIAEKVSAPVTEVAPVTVAPKFDKSKLEAMKKGELEELAKKHGVDVKARAKKDELVNKLSQL